MKNNKLGQEPAFPLSYKTQEMDKVTVHIAHGISKRYWTAVQIAKGLAACSEVTGNAEDVIKSAYIFADELLKQENA